MSEMIGLKETGGHRGDELECSSGRFGSASRTPKSPQRLTPRQEQILHLLAKGFYYKEIGTELGISPFTVRAHLHTVYRKLGVKSRARAVVKFNESTRQT
jgi:DNA-binding CsgD family transcriptional regulator